MDQTFITIVSGLPRSGTSMMMRMLEAGGMEILTDGARTADEDNPKGYYEFERVKQIEHDRAWLEEAGGKAVKMISALLKHLPRDYSYKIVFMLREMEEILASQKQMLIRRGEPTDRVGDERMAELSEDHLAQVKDWLVDRPDMDVLYVSYNEVLKNPREYAERINRFLDGRLNVSRMEQAVDPSLYRQRSGSDPSN